MESVVAVRLHPASVKVHDSLQSEAQYKEVGGRETTPGAGILYVVATPIGNLEDLGPRARRVLETAELIVAEDTRRTGRLLAHFGIKRPVLSLHEHNEAARVPGVMQRLRDGATVALVSDAGTPLLSDPGYRLLAAVREAGIQASPVPGPSAITAALSIAGLPTDRFVFEGFLPARQAARRGRLQALRHEPRTLVLFESGRRIGALLEDLGATFGPSRRATLAREMTKTYESLSHGSLADLEARVAANPDACRGELVLVVEGAHESQVSGAGSTELESLLRILLQHVPLSEAVAIATEATGGRRNAIYRQARALAEESTHRGS